MFDGFFEDTDTPIIRDIFPKKIDRTLLRVWNPDSFILSKAKKTFIQIFTLHRMGHMGRLITSKQNIKQRAAESVRLFKVHGWKSAKILNLSILEFHSPSLKENPKFFLSAINKICRNVPEVQVFESDVCLKLDQQTASDVWGNLEIINNGISKHFINLTQLKLHLIDCDSFDQKGFKSLFKPLFRSLGQLECLQIRFRRFETIDAKAMKIFEKSIAKYLTQLKDLRILFERKRSRTITDLEVQVLVSEIGKARGQLSVFSLDFIDYDNCIKGENFKRLFANSLVFSSLKALKIRFFDCGTNNDIALQQLGLAIGSDLRNLEELNLTLEASSYSSSKEKRVQGFQTLATNICRNLKNLKSITLRFKPIGVNDEDLKMLGSELINLENLQDLSLQFGSIMSISSEALKLPGEIALHFPKLRCFEFHLKSSSQNIKLDDYVLLAEKIAQCKVKWEAFNLGLFQPLVIDIRPKLKEILCFIQNLTLEI